MKRVLVVGINPSQVEKSATHKKLNKWLDYLGLDFVGFTNVIWRSGPYKMSDVDWELLRGAVSEHDLVIALGNFPSEALSRINTSHFKLPHPSGLNRLLNDREYEIHQLELCRQYLAESYSGTFQPNSR